MLKKTQFQIVESPAKILEPVTKLGGQPVWIAEPFWPLDPQTGEQMLFLGQISLSQEIFPGSDGAMVYLFFGEDSEPFYHEGTAIVIQTSKSIYKNEDSAIEYSSKATGPTIYELDENRNPVEKEYRVVLSPAENESPIPLKERYSMNDLDYDTGFRFSRPELAGNKIGGQPLYIEGLDTPPEYFNSNEWHLLLQLAPSQGYWNNLQPNFYPFHMELGEFGILSVFIAQDYQKAHFYIQQP